MTDRTAAKCKTVNGDIITIDGPSASGKSTVASRVAAELGRIYVDSGSLYRGITWHAVQSGIDAADRSALVSLLEPLKIDFYLDGNAVRFRIDGTDPREELRSAAVRERVSHVAEIPKVREYIVAALRSLVGFGKLVIEGRDIGSEVFPDAVLKFYLDASPDERARRRQSDLAGQGEATDADSVRESLKRRDERDSSRETAPLVIPDGAVVLDTTEMSIDQVVEAILAKAGDQHYDR